MDIGFEQNTTFNSHPFEQEMNLYQKASHADRITKEQSWLQEK